MATPRKLLVSDTRPGCYHIINSCVRQGYLCGDSHPDRRKWILELIRQAAASFAVHVYSYAIMENHFHLVVRVEPCLPKQWTNEEIVQRWAAAHPKHPHSALPQEWSQAERDQRTTDEVWVAIHRKRLGSISWFMKSIKERIAKRANREDGCRGHFWEARFRSIPLLDQAAVIACMIYNDLNPIRAGLCNRPEDSTFTSIAERCAMRRRHARTHTLLLEDQARHSPINTRTPTTTSEPSSIIRPREPTGSDKTDPDQPDPGEDLWITPIRSCTVDGRDRGFSLDEYLALVDRTGRLIRQDKRGAIPADLAPLLERLDINGAGWLQHMARSDNLLGSAIGTAAARATEAARRGARWIADTTAGLFLNPMTSG